MIYQFQDQNSIIVKQIIINEAVEAAKVGAFTVGTVINNLINKNKKSKNVDYTFNKEDSSLTNSGVYGGQNIGDISMLRFTPELLYVNKDTTKQFTPELNILSCDISVTKKKNLIKTEVLNEKGSFFEMWGDTEYDIQISGLLIGTLSQGIIRDMSVFDLKPVEDIKKLVTICNANISLRIENKYLNDLFGIKRIVIESFDMPEEKEFKNIQKFAIKAYSVNPFDYLSKNIIN